jgi:glycosyltransferase involved in cell wall biosynthesis
MTTRATITPIHEPPEEIIDWARRHCEGPMPLGSVLFHSPSTAFQAPGGGEIQLVRTAEALERIGWPIRLFCPWTDRIDHARLLHLFGMSREGLELARHARARGIPVVLSPISWFEPAALRSLAASPAQAFKATLAYSARRAFPKIPSWRRELLAQSDRILPNSGSEARQLTRLFGVHPRKILVVPNAVDDRFAWASPAPFHDAYGLRDFVLYVGRIEPRKNVLGLVAALAGTGLPLVVIGNTVPGHAAYADACRSRGLGFTHWIPGLPHGGPMLPSAYAAARVFALPSWFETPGLAALEAAAAGCAVVITPLGSTRDYFANLVEYARPDRPGQIRSSILRAWSQGPKPGLASTVKNRYHWALVSRKTAEAYHSLER